MRIETDISEAVTQACGELARHVPFAVARALTWTARDARDALRRELPRTFTVRSPWTARGIQFRGARKDALVAIVGTRDAYMARQATGGVKQAKGGGRDVAIPVGARRGKASKTPPSRWPKALKKRYGNRMFTRKGSGGATLLYFRTKRKKRGGLRLMYLLVPSVHVPKRWSFIEIVQREVREEWEGNLALSLKKALG